MLLSGAVGSQSTETGSEVETGSEEDTASADDEVIPDVPPPESRRRARELGESSSRSGGELTRPARRPRL